jgi:LAS superfamily LD-carboxypeptidase LdcB
MYLYLLRKYFIVSYLVFLFGTGATSCANALNNQQEQLSAQDNTEEVITINGVHYHVPAPWKGNKVNAPKLTYSDFKQIPLKFCKDEGKIYVTIETQKNLVAMLTQAEEDGLLIQVESGYRSANYQAKIFKKMFAEGRDFDDIIRYVAPPGYSNHILGTAVDFSPSNWRFADTKQYLWLQENGHTFGFEEIYSETNRLKMPWEAWHWQYMGSAEPVNAITTN